MGCGISKSDPEDASPTCEFNPAIARQKNVRPIDEDPDVGSDQADQHGQKSITLPVKDDGLVKEPAAVKENKMEKERELEMKEVENEKEKEIANKVSEKAVAEEEGLHHQEEIRVDSHRHDEEEEKEVSDEREDSRNFAPGSPSFREYCLDWDSEGSGTGNSGDGDGAKSGSKSGKEKGSRAQIAKKERKARGFRNILYKGRPTGAK